MNVPRRTLLLTSVLCLLPAIACAEDPYADFRVPEHRTFSWFVNSNGSASWDEQSLSNTNSHGDGASRRRAKRGRTPQ